MLSVLVTNIKGGCGKTTIATNLATAFAQGGFRTALADVDRQKSSLTWLKSRPDTMPAIMGLDWRKGMDKVPEDVQRLVIDVPAGLSIGDVDDLVREADLLLIPVLPSTFDEGSTRRFLDRLDRIKPIRKGKKSVLVVANRVRQRSRSAQRQLAFLADVGHGPVATIHDRAIYDETACSGLGIFDLDARKAEEFRRDWLPLISIVEDAA
ncbi:MAG: ParA family protein [Geminicoccaceae bacterium]|nr:ParA family protein [Geminicoccaceae bacterium]MCB9943274.1 ParA family protein [Geminicoccaceae bacterium]